MALVTALLVSCAGEPSVEVHYSEKVAEVEKTVARIGVEGMMCEIACGGKIRKELSELNGVASASIQFEEGHAINYALVEFNPALVNETELISCINGISDGKLYAVKEMEVTSFAPSGDTDNSVESTAAEINGASFAIPGITDILAGFLRVISGR